MGPTPAPKLTVLSCRESYLLGNKEPAHLHPSLTGTVEALESRDAIEIQTSAENSFVA